RAVGVAGGADGPDIRGNFYPDGGRWPDCDGGGNHRGESAWLAADVSEIKSGSDWRATRGGVGMSFREWMDLLAVFIIPAILVGLPVYGLIRRVRVYERFVEGAKDGFTTAVRIIPYMVAILFAIGMFRASGAMDYLQ